MKTICLGLLLMLLVLAQVEAHQDRLIKLSKDGKLEGLPGEYQPAWFDREKLILRIGQHQMVFPPALANLFPADRKYDLRLAASWYHSPDLLPPYLSFEIEMRGQKRGYNLLINLDSLAIIQAEVAEWQTPDLKTYKPLKFTPEQEKEIEKAVKQVGQ